MNFLRTIYPLLRSAGAGESSLLRLPRNSSDDPLARAVGDVIELPKEFLSHVSTMHGRGPQCLSLNTATIRERTTEKVGDLCRSQRS